MGQSPSVMQRINFEDMQTSLKQESTLIINTLDGTNQSCLISGTVNVESEISILNTALQKNKDIRIVLYGLNAADSSTTKKYEQLIGLGFYNVFLYGGGLFEWLLLQDVFGPDVFPTTSKNATDLLKYKGQPQFNVRMIAGGSV
jgi:hypothetical protein